MPIRSLLLAVLLVSLPVAALLDGFALTPLAVALYLLFIWPQLAAPDGRRALAISCANALPFVALAALWPLVGSAWSIAPQVSISASLRLGVIILLALTCPQGERTFLPLPAVGILLAAFLIMLELFMDGGPLSWSVLLRHNEVDLFFSKDVNRGLCALAVLVWPAAAWLAMMGKKRAAFLLPLLALATVAPLHSISAKVACGAGIVVLAMMLQWPVAMRRLLVCGMPIGFLAWTPMLYLVGPWLAAKASLYNRLPESSQHRLAIWHFAFGKWQERPWLGWGADASRVIPGGQVEIHPGWVGLPMHPHSLPLQILLEQGVIGYILCAAALAVFLRRALPAHGGNNAFAAATIVAYLVIAMAAFNMWQTWWMAAALSSALLFQRIQHLSSAASR